MGLGGNRDKAAKAAEEIVAHLRLVDHVKALQDGQKVLADELAKIRTQIAGIETQLAVLKAEVKLEALKEAQQVVYSVQSGLNDRIERVAIQVARLDGNPYASEIDAALISKPASKKLTQDGIDGAG